MKKILFVLLMCAPAFMFVAHAQKPAVMMNDKAGWHKIGEVTADLKAEKDELVVLGADRFRSIKIKSGEYLVLISIAKALPSQTTASSISGSMCECRLTTLAAAMNISPLMQNLTWAPRIGTVFHIQMLI